MDFSTISSISTTTKIQPTGPTAMDSLAYQPPTVSIIQNISMYSSTCHINILTPFFGCFPVFWYFLPVKRTKSALYWNKEIVTTYTM
jgi:hypothetical protein